MIPNLSPQQFKAQQDAVAYVDAEARRKAGKPPLVVHQNGGKHSALPTHDRLIVEMSIRARQILKMGSDRYDADPYSANWLLLAPEMHVEHAIAHLFSWLHSQRDPAQFNEEEDDLAHALVRCMFAVSAASGHSGVAPIHETLPEPTKE